MAWTIEERSYSIMIPAPLISDLGRSHERALSGDAYLLRAHPEQQPAKYRPDLSLIVMDSLIHDDVKYLHARMTAMLFTKADGAVAAKKQV
jgi:hypothetical protein